MKILFSLLALLILLAPVSLGAAESIQSITSNSQSFPPQGAAWSGTSSHIFLGGQARMFCGSHGTISGSADLPQTTGESTVASYRAVFTGELTLSPPLVENTQVLTLREPISMVERITKTGQRANVSTYSTELTSVEFDNGAFPNNIRIRESSNRASSGRTVVTRQAGRNFNIQSTYNVWLEISVDGGRSWSVASSAVTMNLVPEVNRATIAPVRAQPARQ